MNPKRMLSSAAALSAVILLSGCLGSGSGSSPTDPGPGPGPGPGPTPPAPGTAIYEFDSSDVASSPAAFQALFNEFQSLNDTNNRTTGELAGTASYSGRVGVTEGEAWIMGDIALEANFDTSRVGGTLDGFSAHVDGQTQGIDGALTFSDAEISDNQFSDAALGGTLNSQGDDFIVTGTIGGTFIGDDGGQVIGVIGGSVFDVEDNETLVLTGGFVADRD